MSLKVGSVALFASCTLYTLRTHMFWRPLTIWFDSEVMLLELDVMSFPCWVTVLLRVDNALDVASIAFSLLTSTQKT
ncbi:hypothetical protein AB0S65_19980, partial [Escherichia coli]